MAQTTEYCPRCRLHVLLTVLEGCDACWALRGFKGESFDEARNAYGAFSVIVSRVSQIPEEPVLSKTTRILNCIAPLVGLRAYWEERKKSLEDQELEITERLLRWRDDGGVTRQDEATWPVIRRICLVGKPLRARQWAHYLARKGLGNDRMILAKVIDYNPRERSMTLDLVRTGEDEFQAIYHFFADCDDSR